MIIRDAVETDLPTVVEIYNTAVRSRISTAQLEPVSVADRKPWFEQHSSSHPLWVAEEVDRIAGWLSFHPFLPRGAYRGTAEISVYISETFQRQGIGRAMVEKAIAYSPTLHLHTLIAGIFGHNEPSLHFFEQLGFVRWGHLPHIARVDGIARDLVIVGRHIDLRLKRSTLQRAQALTPRRRQPDESPQPDLKSKTHQNLPGVVPLHRGAAPRSPSNKTRLLPCRSFPAQAKYPDDSGLGPDQSKAGSDQIEKYIHLLLLRSKAARVYLDKTSRFDRKYDSDT